MKVTALRRAKLFRARIGKASAGQCELIAPGSFHVDLHVRVLAPLSINCAANVEAVDDVVEKRGDEHRESEDVAGRDGLAPSKRRRLHDFLGQGKPAYDLPSAGGWIAQSFGGKGRASATAEHAIFSNNRRLSLQRHLRNIIVCALTIVAR